MTKSAWGVLVFVATCAASPCGVAQTLRPAAGGQHVEVSLSGGQIVARPLQARERMNVTVKGPGEYWERHEFAGDSIGAFELARPGTALADGAYTFEVRLFDVPRANEPASSVRVAWGRFRLEQGLVLVPAAAEPTAVRQPTAAPEPDADLSIDDATPTLFFNDTDAGATDWALFTNATGFNLQNSTAVRTPFIVDEAAPTNALFVSNAGSFSAVGVGTATPSGPGIHVVGSNSAGLILEPNAGTPWFVVGSTSQFSINNVFGAISFAMKANSPGRSFQIDSTGNVAMFADNVQGGDAAGATLHVKRTNASAKLLVEEASPTTAGRNMLQIKNNGPSTFRFDNTASGSGWGFGSRATGDFFISTIGAPAIQMNLSPAGSMTITGTLTQGSDRNTKADIEAVDAQALLRKVVELPISTWRYKQEDARHVGPMAQDFAGVFGLGADDKHLAPGDMGGVALAAIQALVQQNQELRGELSELRQRVAAVEGPR